MPRRRRGKPIMTTAVTMSAMSNRKTNKMQQQQMQQQQTQQTQQQQNYATAQDPMQPATPVQPEVVAPIKEEEQADQIRTIASAISLYRKKGLSFAEIFTKVEAYNKGFKSEEDFKKGYLDFVNEEAITNPKWESVLEFELEHQE